MKVVVTDANIIINLIHVDQLDLLVRLPGYQFVVPDQVVEEVTDPSQSCVLEKAIQRGVLTKEAVTDVEGLTLYAEFTRIMGRGEAACLTLAVTRGWLLASDEKRVLRREAVTRLGTGRLLNTPGIILLAIKAGLLTVEAADRARAILETRRFRMAFSSFGDLLNDE